MIEKIKMIVCFREPKRTLIDELRDAPTLEERAEILRPFHDRSVFINVISDLIDENKELNEIIKGKEKELEII